MMKHAETLTTTGLHFQHTAPRFQFEDWPETPMGHAIDAPDYVANGQLFANKEGRALVALIPREEAFA
jgi:hypothetical protein